jgi:uncharacterized membrane protein
VSDPSAGNGAAPLRTPRTVPASHAFAWYGEAMRLWRASPALFAVLAAVSIAAELLLRTVPVVGTVLTQVVLPLVECSLLYGSLAADRGDRPRLRHLAAVLGAPPRALVAVVLASLIGFVGQVLAASTLTDIDLLAAAGMPENVTLVQVMLVVAAGVLASLPVSFVAPIALFDDPGVRNAFRESFAAFSRNAAPLMLYGALSLGLFVFGIVTSGVGLLLVLPWLAASSYAAWKDVFAVPG